MTTAPTMTSTPTAATAAPRGAWPATAPDHPGLRDRAAAVLVLAFAGDPVMRWLWPDADAYARWFPALVEVVAADSFTAGTAHASDGHAGTALWVPPGGELDDEAAGALLGRSLPAARHAEAFAFLEQISDHHPSGAHWYLPFIGVDPLAQGRGEGSALLRRGLARADADRLPAYLEASSPRNRALYERHGFAVAAEVRVPGSPPLWPMHRDPR